MSSDKPDVPSQSSERDTDAEGWAHMLQLGLGTTDRDHVPNRYTAVDTIGRGGMGEVLEVVDSHMQRTVALKRMIGSGAEEHRFLQEARTNGRLDHPNIVPVHDIGRDEEGRVYYTMKRIEGESLKTLLRAKSAWSLHGRLQIFMKVCDAMGFAHAQGVVHRDLKPSNIMVGAHGEVLVVDWGIARLIGEPGSLGEDPNTGQAQTGIWGTPGYMAPEQARGEATLLNERIDVYGLGAVLYMLLTGKPFYSDGKAALAAAKSAQAPPIRAPSAVFPRELRAVVIKACASNPDDRFQTVPELQAEIRRFLEDEPLRTARYSLLDRCKRWARRYRTWVIAGSLVSATTLFVFGISATLYVRDMYHAHLALERQLARTEVAQSELLLTGGRVEEGTIQARAGLERLNALGHDTRGASLSARLHDQLHPGRYLRWRAGEGACRGVALNADGSRALSVFGNEVVLWGLPEARRLITWTAPNSENVLVTFLDNQPIVLWKSSDTYQQVSLPGGRTLRSFPAGDEARILQTGVLVIYEGDGHRSYDLRTGQPVTLYDGPGTVLAYNDAGNAYLMDGVDGKKAWRIGERDFEFGVGERVFVSPQGRFVYTKTGEDDVLWDLKSGDEKVFPRLLGDMVAFSPDSSAVMLHSFNDEIRVRETITGDVRVKARGVDSEGRARRLNEDGRRYLTGTQNGDLLLYLLDGQGAPVRVPLQEKSAISVTFSRDSNLIAVSGFFDYVHLYETGTRRQVARFGPIAEGVREAAFSPDDTSLAIAGRDGRVEIWDIASGKPIAQHRFKDQKACSVEWLDGSTLIALGCHGELLRWVMGSPPITIQKLGGETWRVRKTKVGTIVVTRKVGPGNLIALDPGTGTPLADNTDSTPHIVNNEARYGLAISPDSAVVVVSSGMGVVYVHDALTMANLTQFGAPWGPGLGVAFHPTLPLLVTSTFYGELVFWDTDNWERMSTVQAHSGGISDLKISDDGRWLASIGDDGMVVFDLDGALPWESIGALGRALEPEEIEPLDRRISLGQAAAKYGAPTLALSQLGDSLSAVERARLTTLSGDPGAATAWKRAAEAGEVSPAALTLILSALQATTTDE